MSLGGRHRGWKTVQWGQGGQRLDHAGPYKLILPVSQGPRKKENSLRWFNKEILIKGMLIDA